MAISYEMRRVLRAIRKRERATPKDCRCGYRTFVALEKRGLIRVETTFSSVAFPRSAPAILTDAGAAAIATR